VDRAVQFPKSGDLFPNNEFAGRAGHLVLSM